MTTPRKTTRTTAPKAKAEEPETIDLDLDDMSMEEAGLLEETLNMGIDEIAERLQMPGPKIKIFQAMLFVTKRREDPSVTMADIGPLKLSQLGGGDPKGKGGVAAG